MKILIVEDDAAIRRLLRALLGDLADAIHECTDGAQALAAYQQYKPDWVLMDIKMMELDGIEATRRLTEADAAAKIVIVSDYDDKQLRAAARQAGACQYVSKDRLLDLRPILTGG